MRPEEAEWIGGTLRKVGLHQLSPVLEIGASTDEFRTIRRPHIHKYIHGPLTKHGVSIITTDIKDAPGVDIVGDIYDPVIQERLRTVRPGCILCCNILEHVPDRSGFAKAVSDIASQSTRLLVTVPFSYPVHLDPIDTYFRPSPNEIAALFPGFEVEAADIVTSKSLSQEWMQEPLKLPLRVTRQAFQLVKFWVGRELYANLNHRVLWLFKPYKVSCVLLRRSAS